MTTGLSHSFDFRSCFLFFFITLIPFIAFVSTTTSTTKEIAEEERDEAALLAFKSKIIHDPQGVLKSWNDSHHFCEWEGVTCGRKHRLVTTLNLRSKGLSGSLTPYLGNLSFLRSFFLQNNSIQGGIPQELGRLFRLTNLGLSNNSLVGEIPVNLSSCSRLVFLGLGHNNLVGKIPPELVSLYNVKNLSLHINRLTGGIPAFLGNITSLEFISMGSNAFGGSIPDSLGRLKNLRALGLGDNKLQGTVPHSLYNFSSLEIFSLAFNQLHGSLPSNLGLTLPNLKLFEITNNSFDGSIPMSLSNASKLELIDIGLNNFSGRLSIQFRGMQNLQELMLDTNNLRNEEVDEMNFVNSMVNCSNLWYLNIYDNQFKGVLPNSIANLSYTLQVLDFARNQFYGSIPPGIDHLVNLQELILFGNKFSGPIPNEIGNLRNLQRLYLEDNQLSAEIPSSLGNLSFIFDLSLQNNKLSGVIPSSLGNLKQLSILNLSQNELIGIIPKQIFNLSLLSVSLSLCQNHLSGSLPSEVRNLKILTEFVVSDNNLFGEIPREIELCSSLEYFFIEGNFFYGSIPPSLSSLRGIRKLDLSRNNFSGKIPKFLETLHLENLNLSFNNLEGEVPTRGVFANASAISVFGNNDRLCGGVADLRLPKCPNSDSKNDKISLVFKITISVASAIFGLTMISSLIFCLLKKRRGEKNSGSQLEKSLLKVSYQRLRRATDGFSQTHLIGVGSFGSVYKGILDEDDTVVAIKVLNLHRQGAFKSFTTECKALRNVRHRNFVRVITSCSSIDFQGNDFKAIIYEFMANGSLETWLHPALESKQEQLEIQSLTLLQRISIAIDVASALDYLHHHCQEPVLHCDLKPSNVLLDSDMIAHVGDFGLAQFLTETPRPNQSSSVGVKGTVGYAAPEYGLGSEVSTNGDVYSYGILLLEIITSKKPTNIMFEGDFNLHNFARRALPNRVMEIVDPILINKEDATGNNSRSQTRNNFKKECLMSMVRIGVTCSMESPQDRMSITHVVSELQSIRRNLLQPTTTRFN